MRKLRALVVVTALAAVALLVPATAQAGPADRDGTAAEQNAWNWRP